MKNITPILKEKFILIISLIIMLIIMFCLKNYKIYFTFLDNMEKYKIGLVQYRFSYVSITFIIIVILFVSYYVGYNLRSKYEQMLGNNFFRNNNNKKVALHNIYQYIPTSIETIFFIFTISLLFFLTSIERSYRIHKGVKFYNIFDDYVIE